MVDKNFKAEVEATPEEVGCLLPVQPTASLDDMVHGILKNTNRVSALLPHHHRANSSGDGLSTENLLSASPELGETSFKATSSSTLNVADLDPSHEEDIVEVPLHEKEDIYRKHRSRPSGKVQFPEELPGLSAETSSMPYSFSYQDSDAFSSRASSVMGTDDESEDYDWSDEEDLVDEHARFEQQINKKKVKKGWGIKRYVVLTGISGEQVDNKALFIDLFLCYFPHSSVRRFCP